jgi:hypothetical protein
MHFSPWRLYKWKYDHLHVPVVVRAGKERRSTTDRSQYVWRRTVKVAALLNPCRHYRPSYTDKYHYARDRHRKTWHCTAHTITAAQAPLLLDYFIYNAKACQKLWTIFISFGKTATTDIKTTDTTTTTTTTRHLIGVHRSMFMNVPRLTNKRLRMDL